MKATLFRERRKNGKLGNWYVKWLLPSGKYKFKSCLTPDKHTALKIRDEIERQLALTKFGLVEPRDFTWEDAWEEYRRMVVRPEHLLKHEHCYWRQFFTDLGIPTVREVRRADVSAWQKMRIDKGDAPTSVNTKCRQCAAIYNRLINDEVLENLQSPFHRMRRLDEGPRKIRVIPWDKLEAMLDTAKEMDRDLYLVVLLSAMLGLRKAEALAARWEDIDWEEEKFKVRGTKTQGSSAWLPLHEALRERLRPFRDRTGYIVRPKKAQGEWIYRWEWRAQWKHLCDVCGIPDARIHDLRHSFATRLLDLGYPMKTIAVLMRHTSTTMTQRYADLRTVKVEVGRIDSRASMPSPVATAGQA